MEIVFINDAGKLVDGNNNILSSNDFRKEKPEYIWAISNSLTLLEASLPTRNQSTLDKSIPYAIEDKLLGDIEDIHYAWYNTSKNQPLPIAVVDKSIISKWHKNISKAGLKSSKLIPDIFLVPWGDNKPWTLLILNGRSILRTGNFSGISGEHSWILDYLERQGKNKKDIDVLIDKSTSLPAIWKKYLKTVSSAKDFIYHDPSVYINLLQGNYSLGFNILRKLQDFYLPVVASVAVIILLFLSSITEYFQIRSKNEQLQKAIVSQAKKVISTFKEDDPLKIMIGRRIETLQQGLVKRDTSSWGIVRKASSLMAQCNNCVYDSIDFNDNGFSFTVSSYNPLNQLDNVIKEVEGYNVSTKYFESVNDRVTYYKLQVNILAGG